MLNSLGFLPPANEVCGGYVFTGVCLSTGGQCAWQGGMHGRGVCGRGGHAWQRRRVCVAGDMHGRGHVWQGACVVGVMHATHAPLADTTAMAYGQ